MEFSLSSICLEGFIQLSNTFCFISTQFNPSVPPIFLRIHVFCDRLRNLKQNFLMPYDSVLISQAQVASWKGTSSTRAHIFFSPPNSLPHSSGTRLHGGRETRAPPARLFLIVIIIRRRTMIMRRRRNIIKKKRIIFAHNVEPCRPCRDTQTHRHTDTQTHRPSFATHSLSSLFFIFSLNQVRSTLGGPQ